MGVFSYNTIIIIIIIIVIIIILLLIFKIYTAKIMNIKSEHYLIDMSLLVFPCTSEWTGKGHNNKPH